MRIAIDGRYIQDHFPGIARYTYNLIRALATGFPSDELLVLHDPAAWNSRYDLPALADLPGVRLLESAVFPLSPVGQWRLRADLARVQLDLFHTPHVLEPWRLPRPSVITVHDLIPLSYPASLPSRGQRLLFRLMAWRNCRAASAILAPSEATRRDLVERLRVPSGKIHVTPYAADERFGPRPPVEVERVRDHYGLPGRYVLYVGSHKPHKNLDRLVEAWARVQARADGLGAVDHTRLLLAGRGDPRYPRAGRRAQELGLGEGMLFLEDVAEEHLPALYSGAALFVFPSLCEGFGLPVVEAMACGAPVVCSSAPALPEVAGDAALLVDPSDVRAMAAAMGRALFDDALQRQLAAKSRAQAAKFSWERTARQSLAVYDVVAQQ